MLSNFHQKGTLKTSFDMLAQDMSEWPVIDPLPSYGRGRDHSGGRYSNFIGGSHLTDVVITGTCVTTIKLVLMIYKSIMVIIIVP